MTVRNDELPQVLVHSDAHAQMRVGRVTGSIAHIIMRGTIRARNNLLARMDRKQTFFRPEDTPNMPAPLKWGHLNEPHIRGAFFARHPEFDMDRPAFVHPGDGRYGTTEALPWPIREHVGVSPDAVLLDSDFRMVSGLECKAPYNEDEVLSVINGRWEVRWADQCYLNMLAAGVSSWWLVIGNPREPEGSRLRYFEHEIIRDPDYMDLMITKICEFVELWKSGGRYTEPTTQQRLDRLTDLL